jgi:hypothetical protein
MPSPPLPRIRRICLAFPGVFEVVEEAHKFVVRGRGFVMFWPGDVAQPVPEVWCKAPLGAQEEMIAAEPNRFFRPAWRSRPGWIGVRLDPPPDDWDELAAMLEVAYRLVAPKRLSVRLDNPTTS